MSITRRRLSIGALGFAALVLALLAGLWLGVPAAVRCGIETVAAREIDRTIRVGDIRFNPFTLRLDLRDLQVAGTVDEALPLLTLGELHA